MIRSVLAVLGGWASVGVLVVLTDLVLRRMFRGEFVDGQIPPNYLSGISLVTNSLWSIAGGWVTARIAARDRWKHVIGLVVWGEIMGVMSAVVTWGKIQNWYQIGLLAAWIPAVLLGGWLFMRRRGA